MYVQCSFVVTFHIEASKHPQAEVAEWSLLEAGLCQPKNKNKKCVISITHSQLDMKFQFSMELDLKSGGRFSASKVEVLFNDETNMWENKGFK